MVGGLYAVCPPVAARCGGFQFHKHIFFRSRLCVRLPNPVRTDKRKVRPRFPSSTGRGWRQAFSKDRRLFCRRRSLHRMMFRHVLPDRVIFSSLSAFSSIPAGIDFHPRRFTPGIVTFVALLRKPFKTAFFLYFPAFPPVICTPILVLLPLSPRRVRRTLRFEPLWPDTFLRRRLPTASYFFVLLSQPFFVYCLQILVSLRRGLLPLP